MPIKNIIDSSTNYLYNSYFRSTYSKIIMVLYLIKFVISSFNNVKLKFIIYELLFFLSVSGIINCNIYGNCYIGASLIFILNISIIILYIIFKSYIYFGRKKDEELNYGLFKYKLDDEAIYQEPTYITNLKLFLNKLNIRL